MTRYQLVGWLLLAAAVDVGLQGDPTYLSNLTKHATPLAELALAGFGGAAVAGSRDSARIGAGLGVAYGLVLGLTVLQVNFDVPFRLSTAIRDGLRSDAESTVYIQLILVIVAAVVYFRPSRSNRVPDGASSPRVTFGDAD